MPWVRAVVLPGPRELLLRATPRRAGRELLRLRRRDVPADLPPARAARAQRRRARPRGPVPRRARDHRRRPPRGHARQGPRPVRVPARPSPASARSRCWPTRLIVPWFIHGLRNDIVDDVRVNFAQRRAPDPAGDRGRRQADRLADLAAQKPRPTLYKKTADRLMQAVGDAGRAREASSAPSALGRRDPRRRSAVADQLEPTAVLPDPDQAWVSRRHVGSAGECGPRRSRPGSSPRT